MKRTTIYISDDQDGKLDKISTEKNARSEHIRRALDEYFATHYPDKTAERRKQWGSKGGRTNNLLRLTAKKQV